MSDLTAYFIDQVKTAVSEKASLHIIGNGTKLFLGREPDNTNTSVLSTAEHSGIISYEAVELVMTARAGTTLAEIDAELEKNNQCLACDPSRFNGKATIAGSLAANQAGPSRPWTGSLRDHVLGLNLINGKGEHLRFGGKVMKNVAGYDVSRLQAGAMGTLGLITEISFKVLPKPSSKLTLVRALELPAAIQLINQLAGQAKPLTAASWNNGQLYLQLAGAKSAVEGTAEKWDGDILPAEQADLYWKKLRDHELDFFLSRLPEAPLWRFSINSTAPPLYEKEDWLVDWGGALRWLKGNHDIAKLQSWAKEQGGEVVLYKGGDRTQDVYHQPDLLMRKIQKNLKRSFDPENIFNPGRLYSWM